MIRKCLGNGMFGLKSAYAQDFPLSGPSRMPAGRKDIGYLAKSDSQMDWLVCEIPIMFIAAIECFE